MADLRICDIGCGQGELAYRLSELGTKVTGVDLSENLLVYARNHRKASLYFFCIFSIFKCHRKMRQRYA
ncbi:class I SAM-dependent methyltransferase [Paenibacillus sp. AK002]